jgi:hypothetical protein
MKWLRFSTAEFLVITALCATLFAMLATLRQRSEYAGIDEVSISPDGRWITVIYVSGHVSVWRHDEDRVTGHPCALRVNSPRWRRRVGSNAPLQWLDNGNLFVLTWDGPDPTYVLWDTEQNRLLQKFPATFPVAGMVISRDGNYIASLDLGIPPKIDIRTTSQPPITTSIPLDAQQYAQRSPDQLRLVAMDDHQLVLIDSGQRGTVYDMTTGVQSYSWILPSQHRLVLVARDGTHAIASNSEGAIAPIDLRENRVGRWTAQSYLDGYYGYDYPPITFSPDQQTVLTDRYARATLLQLIDDGESPYRLQEVISGEIPPGYHHAAALDRNRFVLGWDQSVQIWTKQGNRFSTHTLRGPSLPGMGFVFYFGLAGGGILWGLLLRRRPVAPSPESRYGFLQLPQYGRCQEQRRLRDWLPIGTGRQQELRALKRQTSSPVREITWGGITTFIVGDPSDLRLESLCVLERQLHRERWVDLTGREYPEERHSLLIAFQHVVDYWLYARQQLWIPAYYATNVHMLFCDELAGLYLQRPTYLLRSLLALRAYYDARKQLLPPPMQAMISVQFQADEWHNHTVAWSVRRLRARRASGESFDFATFFGTTPTASLEAASSIDTRRGFHWWCRYVDLATVWSEFLLGNSASEETRQRVWQLTFQFRHDANLVDVLPHALERPAEELQQSWDRWLANYPVPSTEPAPEILQIAAEKTIPQLNDETVLVHQRGIAIRALGAAGITAAIPALREILDRANSGEVWLRQSLSDIQWSLELLSGGECHAELTPAETIDAPQRDSLGYTFLGRAVPYRLVSQMRLEINARRARALMLIGGLLGLAIATLSSFAAASTEYGGISVMSIEHYLFPPRLMMLAAHTIAIGLSVGKATRGLVVVAILQTLGFIACDCLTPLLGFATLLQMRHGLPRADDERRAF